MAFKANRQNCKIVRDDDDYIGRALVVEGDDPDAIVFHLDNSFSDDQVWEVFGLVQKAVSAGCIKGQANKAAEIKKILSIESTTMDR